MVGLLVLTAFFSCNILQAALPAVRDTISAAQARVGSAAAALMTAEEDAIPGGLVSNDEGFAWFKFRFSSVGESKGFGFRPAQSI